MNNKSINQKAHLFYALFQKIPIAMRITLLLLFVLTFQLQAEHIYSQDAKISLDMRNSTIEKVLQTIEEKSDYYFLYNNRLINVDRKVSVRVRNAAISAVLERLFKSENVDYEVKGSQIILSPKEIYSQITAIAEAVQQQKKTITGTIVDAADVPIIGANIIEAGTTNGTVTDADGRFSLNVENNAIIRISYIGYLEQDINTSGKASFNITLLEDTKALDEVIVTALGLTRSEKALGYATQKFKGDDLQTVKGINIATSLSGRISGMRVYNSTEFGIAPTITLRGESPLIVVDGVPTDQAFSDFNQDVIENITVLKGATASALYGSRGGSGAIMITTKKGSKKKGFHVDINSSTMIYAGELKIPKVQSSYSAGQGGVYDVIQALDYVWGDKLDVGRKAIQWDPITKEYREMELTSKGKNNFKDFLEFSMVSNNSVSISSTGENGSIRTTLSYLYDKNQYPNTKMNKFWYNVGGEMKLGAKASVETNLNFTQESAPNTAGYGYGTGYMYNILIWTGPEYRLADFKDYWLIPNEKQNWFYNEWYDNPYFEAHEKVREINNFTTNGSLSFKYEITPWLKLQLRAGGVASSGKTVDRASVGTISKNRGKWKDGKLGYYYEAKSTSLKMNYDALLMFDKKYNEFSVDGVLGGSIYHYKYNSLSGESKNGLSIPGFYSLKASVETPTIGVSTSSKKVNSLFGTATFSYKDTYYLEATGRNDWSSTLPSNERSYFYPSLGASVIMSNILKLPEWLTFMKLRGSWTISKSDLGIYELNKVYSINQNVWDGLNSASYDTSLRGDVKPITNRTWEIGTNMSLLEGNRIRVDLSYFNKLTYNNTRWQTISSASGSTSRLMNTQEEYVRKGWEITVDATAIKTKDFTWDTSVNFSTARRYYAKLDPEYSADALWIYKGARTDYYDYRDYERDPQGNYVINSNGLVTRNQYSELIGYTDPDFEIGFANTLRYKNFTLGINFDGRIGGIGWANTEYYMYESGTHPDTDNQWRYDEVVNGLRNYVAPGVKVVSGNVTYDQYGRITEDTRVFAPNDIQTSYSQFVRGSRQDPYRLVQDKTFIKLRELSVGYAFPTQTANKLGLTDCHVSLIGQNLFVWTKAFRFSDPDGSTHVEGESLASPSVRYIGLNVKLGF